MKTVLLIALKEIRDGVRNRWIIGSMLLLTLLAITLWLLGSAPIGPVKTDPLAVTVVSLANLSVYLIPLIALTLSFDAVIGEFERGTLLLLLTYPVARWQIIVGKFIGHLAILAAAILIGYGLTGIVAAVSDGADLSSLIAYAKLMSSSLLLGAVFIGLGYLVSVLVRERATAVAYAIGLWLCFVVLYDLILLGIIVADTSHGLSQTVFELMLLASPTDLFRLFNLTGSDAIENITGLASVGAALALNESVLITMMMVWLVVPLTLTAFLFGRREL